MTSNKALVTEARTLRYAWMEASGSESKALEAQLREIAAKLANALEDAENELERVCIECGTTLDVVRDSDDPDLNTPSKVVRISLYCERDRLAQADREIVRLATLVLPNMLLEEPEPTDPK